MRPRTLRRPAAPSLFTLAALGLATALSACRRSDPPATPPPATPSAVAAATTAPSGSASAAPSVASAAGNAAGLDPPAPASDFVDAARVLPQGAVRGWQQAGRVVRATAATLAQEIDGAAVSYEQYGVQHYGKTEYRRPGTRLVALAEVYTFEAPLGAFGRYSLFLTDGRDPSALRSQAVAVGRGGYQGTTQLTFWKGSTLVQISVSDDSDEPDEAAIAAAAREVLPALAGEIARAITDDRAPDAAPLPPAGLVWGGLSYRPGGVPGLERAGAAWLGFYARGEGAAQPPRYRLARWSAADAPGAQRAFAQLRGALEGAAPVAGLGDEASEGSAGGGPVTLARVGNTVFAVLDGGAPGLGAPDGPARRELLRAALAASSATAPLVAPSAAP